MQFFYDGQIRRYVTQLVRLFSNFSYKDGDGKIVRVPVMYGDITRQVGHILRDNSENKDLVEHTLHPSEVFRVPKTTLVLLKNMMNFYFPTMLVY